jgi:uroporphyrinogen-III synthase
VRGRSTILVVRGEDAFTHKLRDAGLDVMNFPLIDTATDLDTEGFDEYLEHLHEYDGIFITSPVAAQVLLSKGYDTIRRFAGKFYVVGDRTRQLLEGQSIGHVAASGDSAEKLLETCGLERFRGKKYLYLRGDQALNIIPDTLRPVAQVDPLVVYRTVERLPEPAVVDDLRARLAAREIEWICFFSPSGVKAFSKLAPERERQILKVAAIGHTTAGRARDLGYSVSYVPDAASLDEFAAGLASKINGS